ncbi:MAG TPA: tetratricopeptide repeat protein [Gemmatimonadaceae bacterium]|nr:tetratricopeptide repeat protein [Gemmatimonadaceae bacterium]
MTRTRVRAVPLMALAFLAIAGREANAQAMALKREVPGQAAAACRAQTALPPASAQKAREAQSLYALGQQEAISGDHGAARDLFRRAAALDPRHAGIAYHLARSHEALGESADAVRELCRYLALNPAASDSAEVRDRIVALAPSSASIRSDQAVIQFRNGLDHYDRGRMRDAENAFSAAIRQAPNWSDAYYNRAVVYLRQGEPDEAARDLERYLERDPTAGDRAAVRDRIDNLRRASLEPGTAFTRGLLVPGLGQIYTRRPALGLLVIAGVAGAAAYAAKSEDITRTVQFEDPFGNPYEEVRSAKEYPNVAVGIAAAAAVTLVGALESYLYARRAQRALNVTPHTAVRRAAAPAMIGSPAAGPAGAYQLQLGVKLHLGQR